MRAVIYYFSGTGNSFRVAETLQKLIPETTLLPILGLLHRRRIQTEAKTIGFVFPVHALCIPIALRRFLRRLKIQKDAYVFAVATREGTAFHGFAQINHLLRRSRQRLRAQFTLTMPGSDPRAVGYRPPEKDDIEKLRTRLDTELAEIAQALCDRTLHLPKETEPPIGSPYGRIGNFLLEHLVVLAHKSSEYLGGVNYFYADESCTSCGICESVCLSGKISLANEKKPVWQHRVLCYMCFACVNYCPQRSVQIKSIWAVASHTAENGRYSHPFANAKQTAAQKTQL